MSWKKVFLGSLYELPSRNGLTRPSKVRGVGYKMVNMGELFANEWLYDIPMERVQLNDREKRECLIAKNDLLFARQSLVASGAGKCSIVREVKEPTTFESHLIRVRLDTTKAVPLFYYYYFKSPLSPMKTIVTICAQAGIRGSDLATLSVECPDLPTQRRIASILSAYDDLIENNRRQIKLLEEAAQRLYREWFVELRFPGHESVKVMDGVPEGWMKVCLKDICETKTGKKDANFGCDDGAYPFFTCAQAPIKAPSYSFDCSAVILAGNGDFKVKLYRGKFEAYQRTYVLSPANTEYLFLLYNAVSRNMNVLTKGASGSTIKFLTKGMIDSIELLIPSSQLLTTYNQNSEALQKSIEALHRKVALAVEARDRLLPKLMNSEMEELL